MSAVWHFILSGIIAFLYAGAAFLAVNLVLFISSLGNPGRFRTLWRIRKGLLKVPPGTVVEYRDGRAYAVYYDRRRDADSTVPLYVAPRFSPLAWKTGPRSAGSLRGRANATLAIVIVSFALVYLPLLAAGAYLAVNLSWLWWYAVIVLAGIQVVLTITHKLFFYLKWRAFTSIIPVVFLHRYHLFSLPVSYAIVFGSIMVSLVIAVWINPSDVLND
jgi:hypothetical protein